VSAGTGEPRVSWLQTSRADYDARLTAKGHKRDGADQAGLFYVATPTADRPAPVREELDGRGDLFGAGE
jgi:hypothetical protein